MDERSKIRNIVDTAFSANIIKRSLLISAIVGSVLVIINHGDVIMTGSIDTKQMTKILLTYCVPYLVSTYSAVSVTLEHNLKRNK